MLTLEKAKELTNSTTTEPHLIVHATSVMAAMGAMAEHYGEDKEHWMAIGYLHDYDYEQFPEEHLQHTEEPLLAAGVDPEDVHIILAHGWGLCSDVEPDNLCAKCLYTVDELTGIVHACARMRPHGITDLEVSSFMKKFKDKKFAAKCNRDVIKQGCGMLGIEVRDAAEVVIRGMKEYAEELGLLGTEA